MIGTLNFANALAGTLSFMGGAVVVARTVQLFLTDPNVGATITPAERSQGQRKYKADRIVLLVAVGLLLLSEFVLDYRVVYGRHINEWASTQLLAVMAWFVKAVASLVISRQFSVRRCGEKGWITMLIISLIVAFFLI
jgi:hypothetical protein